MTGAASGVTGRVQTTRHSGAHSWRQGDTARSFFHAGMRLLVAMYLLDALDAMTIERLTHRRSTVSLGSGPGTSSRATRSFHRSRDHPGDLPAVNPVVHGRVCLPQAQSPSHGPNCR